MTIGCGIAVAGIWIGIGICSFNTDISLACVMGMLATGCIALFNAPD